MSKQQKNRVPLLYIHQPSLHHPRGKMQEVYSIKEAEKKKQVAKKEQQQIEDTASVDKREELTPEQVRETIESYEQKRHEERGGLKKLKPFKEMTIDEKLDYLYQFPKQLPPVPCLFQTEDKGLRGILIDNHDKEIVLKLMDKSEVSINKKDLVSIRMIGF